MQIIFESRHINGNNGSEGIDSNQLRNMSTDKVRFALRRLSSLIPRAKVQFSDVNGPRDHCAYGRAAGC